MTNEMLTCRKCGWRWWPIVERPAQCPSCRSRKYWEPRKRPVQPTTKIPTAPAATETPRS